MFFLQKRQERGGRIQGGGSLGQKVHPIGFRLGYIKSWNSKWYAERGYAALLHEDIKIRKLVKSKLAHAGVSRIDIERSTQTAKINIHTARPGIIIGRKGSEVGLKKDLEGLTNKQISVNILGKKPQTIHSLLQKI